MEFDGRALGLLDIFTVSRLSAVLWVAFVLDIVIIDVDSLADLGIKSLSIGQARNSQQCSTVEPSLLHSQVEKFGVVHFKQHASDLAGQFWLSVVDLRIQGLT